MEKETATYCASFRNQELRIWESVEYCRWGVTNLETGDMIAQGEAADRASAMVSAAQAAQADWGSVRWRRSKADNEDDGGTESESSN
jgi:hypothetical protein